MLSCGNDKKSQKEASFSDKADEIDAQSDLSSACQKDLKKYGAFLDDIKAFIQSHSDGQSYTAEEKKMWQKKSQDLAREFATSAGAHTEPRCMIAMTNIQAEFSQTMIKMAQINLERE